MLNLEALGGWKTLLAGELAQAQTQALFEKVEEEYENLTVFPPKMELFSAFSATEPENVKVVILGQDPYHEPGQAHGLAFSVREGVRIPPSLRNMYQELEADLGIAPAPSGDLTRWAEQGVFLLNTVLTVRAGEANSHKNLGWQLFTDGVFARLADLPQPVAFLLWGAQAQKKAAIAADSPYPRLVLQAPHPSPLSAYRGFFGSKPYSQINAFLRENGVTEIEW